MPQAPVSAKFRSRPRGYWLRWQLEELRISLFAQELGTRAPVSEQRVLREIEGLGSSS
jgi:ATP-dependent helicase HrpA